MSIKFLFIVGKGLDSTFILSFQGSAVWFCFDETGYRLGNLEPWNVSLVMICLLVEKVEGRKENMGISMLLRVHTWLFSFSFFLFCRNPFLI